MTSVFHEATRVIPADLRKHYEAEGWWTSDTLGASLSESLTAHRELPFRVYSSARPYAGTFGDVETVARRLAEGLRARGVQPGDVVAFQLPNWMESAATFWAATLLGAVVVPIVHFYGRKELGHILTTAAPKVFITATEFGRMTYHPDLVADVPIVGVVGRDFDDLLSPTPMTGVLDADPAGPALIAFTSGTTRDPKGVVHSHQSLGFEIRQLAANHPPNPSGSVMALPVGHFIGMLGGLLCPVLEGVPVHLCDTWDPGLVLDLMRRDGVGFGGGPTYFITSLLDHPEFTEEHLRYMPYLGLGGSAVPVAVTRRLTDLGLVVTRSYGSTEHPSITGSRPEAPVEKRLYTDGPARPGVELRIASDGEILSRGPDLCLGYLDPQLSATAFDADGWYHTGDVGVLDEDGYLTITDRKADVIIRGGENISAIEVEEALLGLPAVAEAVVVAAPDRAFGERVAAVLRLKPGWPMPTRDDVREHFVSAGMARQKWPEELHQVDDFPRTASGKVQKYLVRQKVRRFHRL
ncbi:AMP-dependent synthetase [Mycolicibacterium novocastrense]|uniref:AMP-binding protein n=1 Tax=Mycolicibacterium novocastrense TaxID=59813 RepID=UPI000746C726|nr:AMP-binding protein [Mycolicibacterium novocastrense]KUH64346.1 AMP-dependent synthetase [Mycolicibacterium novocastrense]KUH65151.1 AMP-dependent synthetase [Mycolicibacterium novocastrense]KUH76191.1 AMP-dependent synthetase [Mycolicibacterium novocastrense]